jgi:nucleotide-binding universal stress UspA family protein
MTTILRPTRGGEASYPNQDRAITLAKERDADLLLLYVANVHFLDRLAGPVIVDVETELEEMGEFLLALAQERAEKAGVRASTLVLRGEFREALEQVIQEHEEITTVVLGTAVEGTGVTPPGYLENLIQWLLTECGIEVVVVDGGEIIEHHKPKDS